MGEGCSGGWLRLFDHMLTITNTTCLFFFLVKLIGEVTYPSSGLTVDVPLVISHIAPMSGSLGGGTELTITGKYRFHEIIIFYPKSKMSFLEKVLDLIPK